MIDENLYFERAGSGDNVPFRLNVFSDLASEWIPGVFKYQWRRSKLNLKKQSEIFGLKTVPIDYP